MARLYKREKIWYIDYHYKGKRIRKRTGTSKKHAELTLIDLELKIARDELGFIKKDITIDSLIERFLEYNKTNNRVSTAKRYKAVMDHFQEFLIEKKSDIVMVSQVNEGTIEEYKSFRKNIYINPNGYKIKSDEDVTESTRKGARSRTINLEVGGIKYMLNLAVRWDYIKENPINGIKPLKEDDKKLFRFLTNEEIQQFLDHTPQHLYPIYFTLLHTGMRKAEIENLTWGDIKFKLRKIHICAKEDWNPKTGEREIPISDELLDVLNDYKSKQSSIKSKNNVFHLKNSGHSHNLLRRELIKIAKEAEIENFTQIHSLRHTFSSHLVMNGVDLPTVQKLLGHADIQTTMIYSHLAPNHLVESVNKLGY